MALAVVGFDLGFQNSYIAVARSGGIETIANEYSDRCTSSCVSFTDTMRFVGNSARQRVITNMKDTLHGFTKFVGKNFDDPVVQSELPYLPYKLIKTETGGVGFRVTYLNEECEFSAEQVAAMMLTKLKSVAEGNLGTPVLDCVLNVPTYYDDRERRALLDATQIAGLNCLKLVNDLTAIALNYGFYKKDLPSADQPPRNVLFVDMGHCDLQVGLVAFNAGQMRVLATACDPNLGGRDLDRVLFNHFVEDFATRLGLDVRSSGRAQLKLLDECSRAKKLMSANSTDIPVGVECLLNERDAAGSINRAEFQRLLEAAGLLRRVEDCVRQCLGRAAGLEEACAAAAIHSVELVGGSTRVPAIKAAVAAAVSELQQQPTPPPCRTTLNADEAVARGCALMCAALSPGCRVRQFDLTDWQPYSISLVAPWLAAPSPALEAFPAGCHFPAERRLRLPVPADIGEAAAASLKFELAAGYTNRHDVAVSDRQIGKYRLLLQTGEKLHDEQQLQPPPPGAVCMRLHLRLDCHGIFAVVAAWLEEHDGPADCADDNAQEAADAAAVAIRRWYRPLVVQEVASAGGRLSKDALEQLKERETQIGQHEAQEQERAAARNAVEEYVYEMRGRLADGLAARLTDAERVGFADALAATEAWLYGEGERLDRGAYAERLEALRREGDAYCRRAQAATAAAADGVDQAAASTVDGKRQRRHHHNHQHHGRDGGGRYGGATEGDMDVEG